MNPRITALPAPVHAIGFDNTLGNYNPTFFAAEALQWLHKSLGFAARVHMGLDNERATNGRGLGEVINIKRPVTFIAEDHITGQGSETQDVGSQDVQVRLTSHKEVKFAVSDVELAYTSEQIINDHIRPAAYALADKIDSDMHALGARVAPKAILAAPSANTIGAPGSYITGPRAVLRKNLCPEERPALPRRYRHGGWVPQFRPLPRGAGDG